MAQNIIFVGPMGAGKTTIGKQLARQLGRKFFDSDRVIEEKTGANIPLIFELEGEAPDYDELVDLIFDFDEVVSWW